MTDIGRPQRFSVDAWLETVEGLIEADEVELALKLLDMAPSWYRSNPPQRALELRRQLNRQLWTPVQYAGLYAGADFGDQSGAIHLLRVKLLADEVRKMNNADQCPLIVELAPGAKFVESALRVQGLKFAYTCMSLDEPRPAMFIGDGPSIFVAFEIIEHLSDETEIYRNYLKFERVADVVMLSTPMHTYGGGMPNWRERELGHLRCYSPAEFHAVVSHMFTGYEWSCAADDTIVLTGRTTVLPGRTISQSTAHSR